MSRDEEPAKVRTVYSLGTSTRSIDDFLDILKKRRIAVACDVRSFPTSRRFPYFSRQNLSVSLEEEGIGYRWLGDRLGGYRKGGYQAHMKIQDFLDGLRELEELACGASTAIFCAELWPSRCHRRHIARVLESRGWKVVHIIDSSRDWTPGTEKENLTLF